MPRANYRELDAPTSGSTEARTRIQAWLADRPQMPYLLPFFAYVALMMPGALGRVGGVGGVGGIDFKALWQTWHPIIYAAENVSAAMLLWYFWPVYTPIRWTKLGWGAMLGLLGTPLWIATHYACLATGLWHTPPAADLYNPDLLIATSWQRWAYLCVRIAGPTLVVPLMEELFFRDFLMRALIRGERFEDVPVGTFSWFSLLGMSILFGLNHGSMWPAGLLYGLMMGVLLIRTKSLGACIVAHAVTNFTLYLYVIYTGDWQFM